MVYGKFYVYEQHTKSEKGTAFDIYDKGGYDRPFLLTERHLPEFKRLLTLVKRPVYGIRPDMGKLSGGPLHDFYCAVRKHLSKVSQEKLQLILIPTGMTATELPMIHNSIDPWKNTYIRQGVVVERALLYSPDHPAGYFDPELISNPLGLLKKHPPRVLKESVASVREIASAVWNSQGTLVVLPFRKHWHDITLSEAIRNIETF